MTASAASGPPTKLSWIQYLRGAAALMVVFYHISHSGEQPWLEQPLTDFAAPAAGVDVFFVISGFIMYTAARGKTMLEFYKGRIIRIVPLYWILTLAPIGLAWLGGELFSRLDIIKSLLFIPFFNPAHAGEIWPLLVPGWTLNFEMFFYLLFGIAIAWGRPVLMVSVTLPALVVAGAVVDPQSAILITYTRPILLEFLAGVWLGIAFKRFNFENAAPLLPIGFAVLLSSDLLNWPRFFEIALPSIAIVAGALGFEARGIGLSRHFPTLLGNASYAIYLSHTILVLAILAVFEQLPLHGLSQFLVLTAVVMTSATGIGILLYKYVEEPLTRFFTATFASRARHRAPGMQ